MPSQAFHLSRPCDIATAASTAGEALPQYTREPRLPKYLQPQDRPATHTQVSILDEKNSLLLASEESLVAEQEDEECTMVPQALLVDAATSLCAYLYFTSLQARMALHQQSSLDLLSGLCSSLPEDADSSILHTCAHAISHQADSLLAMQHTCSHRLAILLVLFKAVLGFTILTRASHAFKPFEYLVASGALHCLLLYIVVFVPVAKLMFDSGLSNGQIWIRVMSKILWLAALCCSVAVVQWLYQLKYRNATRSNNKDEENYASLDFQQDHQAISLA